MTFIPQRKWALWTSWSVRAGVDHELPTQAVVYRKVKEEEI